MTPEELDRAIEEEQPLPPPPATPTPAPREKAAPTSADPFDQFSKVLGALNAMESVINKKIEGRILMQQEMEERITSKIQEQFAGSMGAPQQDPIISEAAKFLMQAWTSNAAAPKPRPVAPPPQQKPVETPPAPEPTPSIKPATIAPPVPAQEVETMKYTDEQIQNIADGIFEKFPGDVRAFKLGVLTRDRALAKVRLYLGPEDAERVIVAMEETEYPMED